MDICKVLPEGCIVKVLSLTSPPEAGRLSLLSSTFRSASESDAVWERFLPAGYQDLICRAVDPSAVTAPALRSKKELFRSLCNDPLLIDGGLKG